MNREIHVPLREGVGVRFPRATRPVNFEEALTYVPVAETNYTTQDYCT
jgi:hypothetical protein